MRPPFMRHPDMNISITQKVPSRLFQVKTYLPKPTLLTSVITDELCLLLRAEYHYVWLLSLNTLVLLNISIANACKSLNNIPLYE